MRYVVTPKGIAERTKLTINFMKRKIKEYDELKKELNENKADLINKWEFIKEVSIKAIKETLSLLDHNFDLWMGESDVNILIPEMIAN